MDGLITVHPGKNVFWAREGGPLTLAIPGAESAYAYGDRLFVLAACPPTYDVVHLMLKIFGPDGALVAELPPPAGYIFGYLSSNLETGVSIVCGAMKLTEPWADWHFAYDPLVSALVRLGPAY
ncbi:hypothetical protein [Nitrospirillum sp. BR 11828]|uniref:hypothetical protein n=1 Tax=Nitrospirillum sp. BR 11828 TaxID=3104325 RepID=UPI002ACA425B|nr:hypothetical protein [Nitrospirillum sp. BR 11828]MDZ5645691.1 hypothetical protein [Nitrospirillum sp. BR 11828]